MDGHPIPRQITTFEFKLIGFMTLRQFLIVVVAIPLGYVIIQLFPIPLLNILLGVLVAVIGVVTAFLPIKDRTLDVWIKTMWKRLQNPTQYYYHKRNDPLYFLKDLYFLADPHHMLAHVESKEKLSQYLAVTKQRPRANYQKKQVNSLLHTPTDVLQKSTAPIQPAPTIPVSSTAPVVPPPVTPAETSTTAAPTQVVQTPAPAFPQGGVGTSKVEEKPQIISQGPQSPIGPQTPTVPVMQTVVEQPAAPAAVTPAAPPLPVPVVIPPSETVSAPVSAPSMPSTPAMPVAPTLPPTPQAPISSPQPAARPGMPTIPQPTIVPPSQPFLAGIVRTAKKIPLPGVLIYVKDNQGNPLRILKTNPHGVFATYQALPAGEYLFEIKDPNGTYFFDTMDKHVADVNSEPLEFQSKEIL